MVAGEDAVGQAPRSWWFRRMWGPNYRYMAFLWVIQVTFYGLLFQCVAVYVMAIFGPSQHVSSALVEFLHSGAISAFSVAMVAAIVIDYTLDMRSTISIDDLTVATLFITAPFALILLNTVIFVAVISGDRNEWNMSFYVQVLMLSCVEVYCFLAKSAFYQAQILLRSEQ